MLTRLRALPVSARVARTHWLIAGVVATWIVFFLATSSDDTGDEAVILSLLLLAFCAGVVLDDPAAVTLQSSPTPLLARRLLRAMVALVVLIPGWVIVLVLASRRIEMGNVPTGPYTLELAALVVIGLACAGAATRRPPGGDAAAGGAAGVLVFVMVSQAIAYRWDEIPSLAPNAAHHDRWWIVLVVAAIAFLAAARDPAARVRRLAR